MPDRMIFPSSYYGSELTPDQEAEHERQQEEAPDRTYGPDCYTCADLGTVHGVPCVDCSTDQ